MSEFAIRAEGLSKRYVLGEHRTHSTLREAIARSTGGLLGRRRSQPSGEFWALSDVSFELRCGEVLGIIGSNGAGKSTLLKILSRITEPTKGRAELVGRVGSLLEVGTGFHPELTGRENVFLNGAILGMHRNEVMKKFDEIVDFSGVSRFIDTPVKRYSSGMQLRLAFAVAAHLDPEILIVDEVLAVGDATFQTKCLQKMESVSQKEGRTILFVSHNMGVVRTLCSRALLLESGRIVGDGDVAQQISGYLRTSSVIEATTDLSARTDRAGDGRAQILRARIGVGDCEGVGVILSGQEFRIDFDHSAFIVGGRQQWALSLFNDRGEKICHLDSEDRGCGLPPVSETGRISLVVLRPPLPPGTYTGDVRLTIDGIVADYLQRAFSFRVEPGDFFGTGRITPNHGEMVYLDHSWESASGKGIND